MSTEEDLLLAVSLVVIVGAVERPRLPRRFWIRPSLKSRNKYSASDLLDDLILDDSDPLNLEYRVDAGFRNCFRMTSTDFEILLGKIGPQISKKNTTFRKAIPAHERLAVTLRFLATGDSYHSLMYTFKISKQVISRTVPEVCDALISALKDSIKMPCNVEGWEAIAREFEEKCNFPHCVGAMDGKHVSIQAPIKSGSEFFNYKGYHSIVIFAVVDANYNFLYANVGCQGRISDGGVFDSTLFKKSLEDNTMHLPEPRCLPGQNDPVPYVFVADDAFPLKENIMKPFSGPQPKGSKNRRYNYRVSRARVVSENAFGVLSSVFKVVRKPMLLQPEIARKIILTIIYLHNYLRAGTSRAVYTPVGIFDTEREDEIVPGSWRNETSGCSLQNLPRQPRRSKDTAKTVRLSFADYFSSPAGKQ